MFNPKETMRYLDKALGYLKNVVFSLDGCFALDSQDRDEIVQAIAIIADKMDEIKKWYGKELSDESN